MLNCPHSGVIEFDRGNSRRTTQGVRVRGERERDERELLDGHLGGHRGRRQLCELDRAFPHDVAAQDRMELAVDDQLAESGRAAVDDWPRERVEANRCRGHVMGLASGRLGQSGRGVLGVGEAADRAHL
jgi:hypothetical protein